jgi:hypothetical protein
METEITPLLIMTKLDQFDYAGATALALVMLVTSFAILLGINALAWRQRTVRVVPTVRERPTEAKPSAPPAAQAKRSGRP